MSTLSTFDVEFKVNNQKYPAKIQHETILDGIHRFTITCYSLKVRGEDSYDKAKALDTAVSNLIQKLR